MTTSSAQYWRDNTELAHITPPGARFAEGFDVFAMLRMCIPDGQVLDFGCGDARLAPAFESWRYTGCDVNPAALDAAREDCPRHAFKADSLVLPFVATVLAYTVLLHVPDDEIGEVVRRLALAARRVLVVEILGREWRRDGDPPVFNRYGEDYESLFDAAGMKLAASVDMPYERYGGVNITFLDFRRGPKEA